MDDNFEKWLNNWDAAQKEIEEEKGQSKEPVTRTSYFTGSPSSTDYQDVESPNVGWTDIYQRAMEVDFSDESLLTDGVNVSYAGSEGYGKQSQPPMGVSPGGKKVYTNNPVHFSSVGNDQEGEDGHVRVSNNFSDGKELLELDDVKRRVEKMERDFHASDILHKPNRAKLESQLNDLRDRVKKLSQKLVSDPQKDLA
jgi:hypothetical protein